MQKRIQQRKKSKATEKTAENREREKPKHHITKKKTLHVHKTRQDKTKQDSRKQG